jgi:hypothetical protein
MARLRRCERVSHGQGDDQGGHHEVFGDVSLAAALIDRLLHHGQVVYLKGPSWRTRDRPEQAAATTEEVAG